jgi:HlyD family secretion protein
VEARIVIWSADNAVKVPESAVFRQGQAWNAFVIAGGRAQRREIEIGHRSDTEEEVLRGLAEGDQVILHPANQLSDGVRVQTKPG